jgi:hypothetical protein
MTDKEKKDIIEELIEIHNLIAKGDLASNIYWIVNQKLVALRQTIRETIKRDKQK